ncbi:MAG: AAA family ATPase [Planctomycetaceae bacterium]|nr:AAA family ATPase [Planctomycetaceae bacterium]
MILRERLSEYIRACFTGLWIESHEHADALTEIARLCRDEQWHWATWDIESGLTLPGQAETPDAGGTDPLAAIRSVNALVTPEGTAILVLQNFHRFLQSAEIVQALSRQIIAGKQNRTILVILAPVVQIPTELEKMFVVIEHELPGREQLEQIARGIAVEEGELPDQPDLERLLDAASGLTRLEAENAYSLSLVRHSRLMPETVWDLKTQTLRNSGLLSLYRGSEDFSSLGGLEALKSFCRRSMLHTGRDNPLRRPRGVLLLGVPGTGKSAFAKALGRETGRPTLVLDVGSLLGSLVGQTEQNVRQALWIADAMAPCILFIDELEKALSGISGQGDSGVSSRLFGTILTWMNDHTSDVYLIATCNDISRLPPEISRAERFDAVVFLDLPGRQEKQLIWSQYLDIFQLDRDQRLPLDEEWTGAEIKACCRLAALLDVPLIQAAQNVVPVAVTAAESVERLRNWASGRCLSASQPGIYRQTGGTAKSRRRVSRDPSNN